MCQTNVKAAKVNIIMKLVLLFYMNFQRLSLSFQQIKTIVHLNIKI